MKPYFEKMSKLGKPLKKGRIKSTEDNVKDIKSVEAIIDEAVGKVKAAGLPE